MAGTLYLVATPIGNLSDITLRALDILAKAAAVACEDTRHSRKLFEHHGIEARLISLHEHNEAQRSAELIARLQAGEDIALISDAGTPLVSDPGYRLVREARAAGIKVSPIPGASAAIAALAASGLPTDEFHFAGFLPRKSSERRRKLAELAPVSGTLVFYEAPHRLVEMLEEAAEAFGAAEVVVAREITKVHEEFTSGTAAELAALFAARAAVKGEITVLVGERKPPPPETSIEEDVQALVSQGTPQMEAIKTVARLRGVGKREVYELIERGKRR